MTRVQGLRLLLAAIPVAAVCAFAAAEAYRAPSAVDGFQGAAGIVAAAGLAVAALALRPAWTLTAAVVLTAFNSHWEQEIGVPVALDRMALALGAVSLLAREVAHRDGRLRTLPVHWLMFAASLYVLVSMLLADPLDDTNARVGLLDRIGVIPFVLFFLVPFAFRTEEDRRILLGGLVALGGYLGLIALLEATGPRDLIVPNYINDPSLGIHYDRSRGPFLEAGANGISMYACAVAAAVAFAVWRDRRWRVVAGVVTLLCLLGTILTLTRAVWLAALVASPIALLAARELRRYVVPAVVGGLILVTGALAVVPNLSYRAEKRNNDDGPLWDRRNSNRAALNMVRDKPVFGFGWGQFRDESALYYRQSPDYPLTYVKDLHNAFLSNAVELGIVGAALWFVAVLAGIGGAILRRGPPELRPWKIGLIALAVSQAVSASTTPFDFVLPTLLLWMWAGVAWGPRPGAGDEPGGSPEPARA